MRSLLDQLDHEWETHIGHDRAVAARLPEVGALTGCGTLDEARRWTLAAPAEAADRVLVALVARAVEGDGLAARALLGWLTPGIRALVRRWAASGDRAEVEAAAVASVYERIVAYPLARRPRKIAANILLDAAKPLRRAAAADAPVVPAEIEVVAVESGSAPGEELLDTVAVALAAGIVDVDDARIILANRVGDTPMADLARHAGTSRRSLERRRRRAEDALVAGAAVL